MRVYWLHLWLFSVHFCVKTTKFYSLHNTLLYCLYCYTFSNRVHVLSLKMSNVPLCCPGNRLGAHLLFIDHSARRLCNPECDAWPPWLPSQPLQSIVDSCCVKGNSCELNTAASWSQVWCSGIFIGWLKYTIYWSSLYMPIWLNLQNSDTLEWLVGDKLKQAIKFWRPGPIWSKHAIALASKHKGYRTFFSRYFRILSCLSMPCSKHRYFVCNKNTKKSLHKYLICKQHH